MGIFTGNISQSQYEALRKEVNWEQHQPEGGVFHAASFDDSGHIHVADIWESADAMNSFVEKQLAPAMQKLQITPPDVEVYPTHYINAYKSIEKYKIWGRDSRRTKNNGKTSQNFIRYCFKAVYKFTKITTPITRVIDQGKENIGLYLSF